MARFWVRFMLFVSSYAPLLVIYAVLNWQTHRNWSIGLLSLAVISVAVMWAYFAVIARNGNPHRHIVRSVQQREGEVLNYIAAYIVPFVTFPFSDPANFIAILILFAVLCVVYINSNLIGVNPMLSLFGYHIFDVQFTDDEERFSVIARRQEILRKRPIVVVSLRSDLYLTTARSRDDGWTNSGENADDSKRNTSGVPLGAEY